MDVRQLAYFLAIAEEKNISKAAEKLHIAQPPLSQQLKLLEDELGIKLVERSTRKFEITDAGEALKHKAKQILELVDGTVKELQDINKGLQGILSIGSIGTVGSTLLLKIIDDFHKKYPGINFHIVDEDTEKNIELLNSGVIDVGIVRTPINKEIFEAIELPNDPMVAVASGEYWQDEREVIKLTDLHGKPLIIQRRYEKSIVNLCREAGVEPYILCRSNDIRTIIAWANLGMGIAIVPRISTDLMQNTDLSYKEIEEPFFDVGSAVIWLKGRYLSSAARHFIENLKAYIETTSI